MQSEMIFQLFCFSYKLCSILPFSLSVNWRNSIENGKHQNFVIMISFEQECIPVGCIPAASMVISTRQGCLPRRVSARECRGCVQPQTQTQTPPDPEADPPEPKGRHPPWSEWLTDRCKNITFSQLRLRVVTSIHIFWRHHTHSLAQYNIPLHHHVQM